MWSDQTMAMERSNIYTTLVLPFSTAADGPLLAELRRNRRRTGVAGIKCPSGRSKGDVYCRRLKRLSESQTI